MRKLSVFNHVSLEATSRMGKATWAGLTADHARGGSTLMFSKTLSAPAWQNTRAIRGDITTEVAKLKREPGADMVILGSGTLVAQLTDARLIDAYQIVLHLRVLGGGRTMFDRIAHELDLRLIGTRSFGHGNVLLDYVPA